jgi:structure-specific recognition protein 1
MAWKGGESDHVVSIPAKEIKWAQWLRVARNFQLRVGFASEKERGRRTFDGFDRQVMLRVFLRRA